MDWEQARADARELIEGAENSGDFAATVKKVAKDLRDSREYDLLDQFVEELRERGVTDPELFMLQAQSLIERGKPATALVLLEAIANSEQFVEAHGLIGRAWKQIFLDSQDKTSDVAKQALLKSFNEYKTAYDRNSSEWAGLNLLALAVLAKRHSIPIAEDFDIGHVAKAVLQSLEAYPEDKQDWYHASKAEACLGLGDLTGAEQHIGAYVQSDDTTAFALAGTLRQFTDLWQLDKRSDRGPGIIQALRAALLKKNDALLDLTPEQIRETLMGPKPPNDQLQAILGTDGVQTYEWLRTACERARSVGAIRTEDDVRIGTGFLVSATDFIPSSEDEYLVMTNAHVISDAPEDGAAALPGDARIVFEAADKGKEYRFTEVVWRSPMSRLDCALLRLSEQPQGIDPLRCDTILPAKDWKQRVYVIGYPGGRALAFSLQDNLLIDHEGAPDGQPPHADVCRLQYRAPTEPGSSGSPVFRAKGWKVVALHHAGSKSMPKLNGKAGRWPANEGIWIQSILNASRGNPNPQGTPAGGNA